MYKVSIFNDAEIVIHYPSADAEAPHLSKIDLKEGLSLIDSLSFTIYSNNAGYSNLYQLTTKIKVFDTRDNSIRFTGRVLDINENMDSLGLFYKEVLCESALSFLNDSKQRVNAFATTNTTTFLTEILAIHNSKVDVNKRIQVGNINIAGSVAYSCEFESTLQAILNVKEKLGGDIRVREESEILYLDWLDSFSENTVNVTLGENMKDMVKGKDFTSLGTRIIPLGANNLTIASVNSGLDYIEDASSKAIYGIIEKTVEYRDIEDATELYNAIVSDLNKYTQPLFLLETSALDLSCLTGDNTAQFKTGSNLHILNPVMAIDSIYKIVQMELDLLQPYNPKLTIANFPLKLTTSISDLRKTSVQNNGVYNNVQIGDAFGIRAVRSDGKVTTTVNATEGISIENQSKKVFTVDSNGDIVANDGTYNNITAEGGTFNNITANNGIFNNIRTINMIATQMRTSNTNNYMIMQDQYIDIKNNSDTKMKIGYFEGTGGFMPIILLGELSSGDGAWMYYWEDEHILEMGLVNGVVLTYKASKIEYQGSELVNKSDLIPINNEFTAVGNSLNSIYGMISNLQSRVSALESI